MNEIEQQDTMLEAIIVGFQEIEEAKAGKDPDAFACWYLKVVNECDADEAKVKEMSATMLRDVATRRKALQYVHGQRFQDESLAKLEAQHGKSKTVKYVMGSAGMRKSVERLEFIPEEHEKLVVWLMDDGIPGLSTYDSVKTINKTYAVLKSLARYPNDDESLMTDAEWADAVTLNKKPFLDYYHKTGEIPPGCKIIPASEHFHINGKQVQGLALPEPKENE